MNRIMSIPAKTWAILLVCVLAVVLAVGGTLLATRTTTPAATAKPAAAATAPAKATTAPKAPAPATTPATTAPATTAPAAPAAPPVTIINNPPAAGSTVYVPVPEYNVPSYVSVNVQVIQTFYADINDGNFNAAWNLGGYNLAGAPQYDSMAQYNAWIAGYGSTSWVDLSAWSYDPDSNAVQVTISATQTDGSVNTYAGTYTVENGIITGANIIQTS